MTTQGLKIARRFLNRTAAKKADIMRLRPQMAKAAQKAYDEWDEDYAEELGGGGICQDIAEEIAGVLNDNDVEAGTISASVGDQHVYTIAKVDEGVFEVDIDPHTYERGSGYKWTKIPDVTIKPEDIYVSLIHDDPEKFEECLEEP